MQLGNYLEATTAAQAALDAGADILAFRASFPLRVIRWGAIVSVALDCTPGALTAKLDHSVHSEAGVPTRSDGSGGRNLTSAVDRVVGTVLYVEPLTEIIVKPGDILHVQVTGAATAGDGFPFIHYQPIAFTKTGARSQFSDLATSRLVDAAVAI